MNKIIEGLEIVKSECGKHLNEGFAWICQPIDAAIKALEQEPKTGHWIDGKCSECGNHAPYWSMASTYYESDFCPKCGCQMEGDKKMREAAKVGTKAISTLDALKEQIASIKRNTKSENSDYLTGYLCALSAVEGMIGEERAKWQ